MTLPQFILSAEFGSSCPPTLLTQTHIPVYYLALHSFPSLHIPTEMHALRSCPLFDQQEWDIVLRATIPSPNHSSTKPHGSTALKVSVHPPQITFYCDYCSGTLSHLLHLVSSLFPLFLFP